MYLRVHTNLCLHPGACPTPQPHGVPPFRIDPFIRLALILCLFRTVRSPECRYPIERKAASVQVACDAEAHHIPRSSYDDSLVSSMVELLPHQWSAAASLQGVSWLSSL